MENKSHALIAGIFTIVLSLAVVLAAVWLNQDTQTRVNYELVTTGSVAGLNPQAAVKYRGMEVGKVESILFDTQKSGQIIVKIGVLPTTPMTTATVAELGMQGLTGLAFIQLNADDKESTNAKPLAKDARLRIRPSLFDRVSDSGELMVNKASAAIDRVNVLLGDDNQKTLASTLKSFDRAAGRIDSLVEELTPTAKGLPGVVKTIDKTVAGAGNTLKTADVLISDLGKVANNLNSRLDAIERITKSIEKVSADVSESAKTLSSTVSNTAQDARVDTLSSDLSRTSRTLEAAVEKLADEPSSVVFGAAPARPGPGESGFVAPVAPLPTPAK